MFKPSHLSLVALLWLLLAGFIIASDSAPEAQSVASQHDSAIDGAAFASDARTGESAFRMPYDTYTVTQGPHGFEYGHAALDLGAGEGASIHAPITGVVTLNTIDDLQNTVLRVLKNS